MSRRGGSELRACQRCYRRHWACFATRTCSDPRRGGFMSALDLSRKKRVGSAAMQAEERQTLGIAGGEKGKCIAGVKGGKDVRDEDAQMEYNDDNKGEVTGCDGRDRAGREGQSMWQIPARRSARVGEANGLNQPHSECRETKLTKRKTGDQVGRASGFAPSSSGGGSRRRLLMCRPSADRARVRRRANHH